MTKTTTKPTPTADSLSGTAVFSSVKSRSGTIEDATLDSIVSGPSIPGDGVRLRDALAAGFVVKNADGTYSLGDGTFDAPQQEAPVIVRTSVGATCSSPEETREVLPHAPDGGRPAAK